MPNRKSELGKIQHLTLRPSERGGTQVRRLFLRLAFKKEGKSGKVFLPAEIPRTVVSWSVGFPTF